MIGSPPSPPTRTAGFSGNVCQTDDALELELSNGSYRIERIGRVGSNEAQEGLE